MIEKMREMCTSLGLHQRDDAIGPMRMREGEVAYLMMGEMREVF